MIKEENSSEKNSKIQKSMSHIIEPYNFKFQLLKKLNTCQQTHHPAFYHHLNIIFLLSIVFFFNQ